MANTHPGPLHPSPVLQLRTWRFAVQRVEVRPVHMAWLSESSHYTPSLGAHSCPARMPAYTLHPALQPPAYLPPLYLSFLALALSLSSEL